jgi:hypothetical protein
MRSPKQESYRYWLYEYDHPNIESILFHFDSLLKKYRPLKLNVIVIYSMRPLDRVIQEWCPEDFESKITGDSKLGIFTLVVNRDTLDGKVSERARVIRIGEGQIYLVINDYVTGRSNQVIVPFLNALYPDIARIYYSSYELYYLLRRLQDKMSGAQVLLHRATRVEGIGIGRRTTNVTYMNRPFEEIFKKIFEQRVWINNVSFSIQDWNNQHLLRGYLSKNGRFRCSRSFREFFDLIIAPAAKMAEIKKNAFYEKNRTPDRLVPHILQLSYEHDVFGADQIAEFAQILASLPSSSTSVFHMNPYFHAAQFDRLDGSSYDLWIVTLNKIHIVPQMRASVASISRLVNYIFENFREGDTEGYVKSSS